MKKFAVLRPLLCGISLFPALAKQDPQTCGTHPLSSREELFLHRKFAAARRTTLPANAAAASATDTDAGQIAVLGDGAGVVGRRNPFDLDQKALVFQPVDPAASGYTFTIGSAGYDAASAASGTRVALQDDDTSGMALPFEFPYFGSVYRRVYVNSDGNLTFGGGDGASGDRSLGRFLAGLPRIAPLYTDLDPSQSSQGVRTLGDASRFTVSWAAVPVYSASGGGARQTFQVRLYPDGRIEMAWSGVSLTSAVVGLSPGGLQGTPDLVTFVAGGGQRFSSAVAERFSGADAVDTVTAAQRFYRTHEDAYDYLVLFNNEGVTAGPGVVAYEVTARNARSGYGDTLVDDGREYGSAQRLQSVLNMGPLSQYPADPNAVVAARSVSGDTPLTILGHEAGHLFLAFASVPDPNDPKGMPMLGRSLVHWSFLFNSEASLLEGNRIQDNGPDAPRRFTTVATVEGYAPLDQYLMGFRPPEEVPATFLVSGASPASDPGRAPQAGVEFNGQRHDISVQDVIAAVGRRTPDSSVAQRRFRFAFVLIAPEGTQPSAADLAKIESFRSGFEQAYGRYSSNRAVADAGLKRAVQLSLSPAAGVLLGTSGQASLTLNRPAAAGLTVLLRPEAGLISAPASVTIPAGASSVAFVVAGLGAGVDTLTAEPADSSYETATARVQVLASAADLKLIAVSGVNQAAIPGAPLRNPVVCKVSDLNGLPYPGISLQAAVTGGGSVNAVAVTDAAGLARFQWTPGTGANELTVTLPGSTPLTVAALGLPIVAAGGVLNAASFAAGISPGSIATVFGLNLTGATVSVNGEAAQVFYSGLRQLNFVAPAGLSGDTVTLTIQNVAGSSTPVAVPLIAIQPGLFAAVARVGYAEIYATGLYGASGVTASIGGLNATVLYSGPAPGFPGLFQINAVLPPDISGPAVVVITANGQPSNPVPLQ